MLQEMPKRKLQASRFQNLMEPIGVHAGHRYGFVPAFFATAFSGTAQPLTSGMIIPAAVAAPLQP